MDPERIEALEKIGFQWSLQRSCCNYPPKASVLPELGKPSFGDGDDVYATATIQDAATNKVLTAPSTPRRERATSAVVGSPSDDPRLQVIMDSKLGAASEPRTPTGPAVVYQKWGRTPDKPLLTPGGYPHLHASETQAEGSDMEDIRKKKKLIRPKESGRKSRCDLC